MIAFLLFIFGLLLLLLGSRGVISNAIRIAAFTKIPPFIIGITIVAIGTSLPEMVVSFFGGLEKASGLALGNIIGSNIANIGLILGISLLIHPIYIGKTKTQKNMFVMLLVSLFLFVTLLIDGITVWHGILFVSGGFGVIAWQIIQGKRDNSVVFDEIKSSRHPIITVVFFVASLICLFIGGKLLVDGGIALAQFFHIPPVFIGLIAVALGTSLPELAVSLIALTKNTTRSEEKLVVGNILGSNIFNILFGAGTLGLFGIKNFKSPVSLWTFFLFTVLFSYLLFTFRGKSMPRIIGILFISLYCIYIILLFKYI